MKKLRIFVFLMLFSSQAFSAGMSFLSSSSLLATLQKLVIEAQRQENDIKDYWTNNIELSIVNIVALSQEKELLLKNIKELEKKSLINQNKIIFLKEQEKKLLGISANVESK